MATKVNTAFLKTLKKGSTVIVCAFTGMKLGVREIIAADKSTVTIENKTGEAVFDRKTGKQIDPEPKAERFANYLIEDDGSFVPPTHKSKDSGKKKSKPAKVEETEEEELEDEDDEEAEEEETPAPAKKSAKKKPAPAKKTKSKKQPEPEEDEDEWADDEDDDFEEID